ncbi:UNVERIFIED_CONTAM: hypothetical protein GTU68_029327 [Idotea baltica]|nr:hypothetical protein [Idotea baltica]
MSVLKIDQIKKSYSEFTLQPLSFDVSAGEVLALIGESGSGKTTLLRSLAGFETPDSGEIHLSGRCLVNDEEHALFPHLTVDRNIRFGIAHLSKDAQKNRMQELLEMVNLPGYEKRYPHELSGGEQQRIAIARALAPRPEVLLLDEPFSNLDALIKDQVRSEIHRIIRASEIPAVLVTHDMNDAYAVADQILVLQNGIMQQKATPEEMLQSPANSYVERLMNTVDVHAAQLQRQGFKTIPYMGELPNSQNSSLTTLTGMIVSRKNLGEEEEVTLRIRNSQS